jgi:hypothetical protein
MAKVQTEEVFSVCPAFVMPYMTGLTSEVADALFLLGFGVPFWGLTHVFGRNECIGTGLRWPLAAIELPVRR